MMKRRFRRFSRFSLSKRNRLSFRPKNGTQTFTRVFRIGSQMLASYIPDSVTPGQFLNYPFSAYWQLTSLPNYADLSSSWEKYKIHKVIFRVRPVYTKTYVNSTTAANGPNPIIFPLMVANVKDRQLFDQVITQIANTGIGSPSPDYLYRLRNFSYMKKFIGTKSFKWSCKPKVGYMAYETGIATAYIPKRSWISTADQDTQHFGTIMCADTRLTVPSGTASAQGWQGTEPSQWWQIDQTIIVKFKDQRETLAPS